MDQRRRHLATFDSTPPARARRMAVAAALLTGTLGAGSIAFADEPTTAELLEQVKKLQEQVEAMKAVQARAAAFESNDAGARVLEDAERRATAPLFGGAVWLKQDDEGPFLAGHNGKFLLASPDGNWELSPNFQLQLRGVVNVNNEDGESLEDIEHGMEVRRTKVGFKGHAFTPDLKYDIKFAFSRDGGGATLENAFIDYVPDQMFGQENLGIRAGQFKDMTFMEESVSSSKLTAVDRSLVNESIGGGNTDFIQGAGPMWKGDQWQAILLYTGGANSDNTPWNDMTWDYGLAGRADFILMGDKGSVLEDMTALDTDENSARIGAGFQFSAMGDTRVLHHSLDGQYETEGGLGIFAGYYGRWAEVDGADSTFDMGGMVQVSQLIGDNGWEVFGRYDFVIFEDDLVLGDSSEDFFHEITGGVNKYWKGHKVKMTIDAVYLPSGNPGSNTGIGLRANDGEFDDQFSIRGQFQLLL